MLLTCPQCETHFSVPDDALLPDGKKVRCSICKHTWFQEPLENSGAHEEDAGENHIYSGNDGDADESDFLSMLQDEARKQSFERKENASHESDDDEDGFPKSLKRAPQDADIIFSEKSPPVQIGKRSLIAGISASAALFVILFLTLIALRGPIISAMPSANGFYSVFGFSPVIAGKGLTFHDVRPEIVNGTIHIKAKISNLGIAQANLPYILAEQLDGEGATLASWIIDPPFKTIIGGGTETFSSEYAAQSEIASLRLSFVVKPALPKERKGIRSKKSQATESRSSETAVSVNQENSTKSVEETPATASTTQESAPVQEDPHSSPAH